MGTPPKVVKRMRIETPSVPEVRAAETAGYQPAGPDGIAASPKVRSMLDERQQTFEIAPLK
jgi:hypothetical protein